MFPELKLYIRKFLCSTFFSIVYIVAIIVPCDKTAQQKSDSKYLVSSAFAKLFYIFAEKIVTSLY